MKLIDKDALVAEIKNKKKIAQILGDNAINSSMRQFYDGMKQGCVDILSFIDTLEVGEAVDAEIVEVEDNNNSIYAYTHLEICTDEDLSKICKAGDKTKVIIIKQK